MPATNVVVRKDSLYDAFTGNLYAATMIPEGARNSAITFRRQTKRAHHRATSPHARRDGEDNYCNWNELTHYLAERLSPPMEAIVWRMEGD